MSPPSASILDAPLKTSDKNEIIGRTVEMDNNLNPIRDFVWDKIRQAAKENWLPEPDIDDNFNLVESRLFDSLGFVGLLSAIEKEFHFTIDPAELESEDLIIFGNLVRAAARSAGKPIETEGGAS